MLQDAVTGTVEPVAMLFCLLVKRVSIRVATDELFQYEEEIELVDQEAVIGYVDPVANPPVSMNGAYEAEIELLLQLEVKGYVEPVASPDPAAWDGAQEADTAQEAVIGYVDPVPMVPACCGALEAQEAVIGSVDPVAMFHCLLLRIVEMEELSQ